MKKLLVLPLLLGFTSPALAGIGTWTLLGHSSAGTYTVKMVSKDMCETSGQIFIDPKNWEGYTENLNPSFVCIKGRNK